MEENNRSALNFLDRIKADKVLLIIILGLMMMSVLAIFSSTSTLVTENTSRMSIFLEQLVVVAGGLLLMFVCYKIPNITVYRVVSQIGFIVSALLLIALISHFSILGGRIRALNINGAYRFINFFGFQIAVFEVVKVLMVPYIGWAVQACSEEKTGMLNRLIAKNPERWGWMDNDFIRHSFYIYIPIGIICLLLLIAGSNSSLFICALVMFSCLLIGGFPARKAVLLALVGAGAIVGGYMLNYVSNGKIFSSLRIDTLISRVSDHNKDLDFETALSQLPRGSAEWRGLIDDNLQTGAAQIAIHEGGLFGKGAGNSTQKYIVPQIFGDYMFSFICEEYGIWGALLIIILFGSLLARGSIIADNCEGVYARTVVGGYCVLISGQALMHILVNVGLMPMTGQTLPLISDGKGAFIMFSLAFGILLGISKFSKQNVERAERRAREEAEVGESLSDLGELDDRLLEEDNEFYDEINL
ncbi:MAG: FtsW/RodA/SpoVE family cell cycle protein [Bacteroidales bacterium]|nr:FtsW/RodA/SpoVE family cell cycle protein [Bacteroidales bacterium]